MEIKLWLNKTIRVPTLKWPFPIRMKQRKKKNMIKSPRTEQLLFFFVCRLKLHLSFHIYFTTQTLQHKRVARTQSPHRTLAVPVLMEMPLLHGFPPRRGESEPSPGGRFPTLHLSCGQEPAFTFHQVHRIRLQAVRCWVLGFRSCATPLSTSRRRTLYNRITTVTRVKVPSRLGRTRTHS